MYKDKGIGSVSVLTLIFVALKIAELIDWSWIWVFSPIWISSLFWLILYAIILIWKRITRKKW